MGTKPKANRPIRLLIVGASYYPHAGHGINSGNVVLFEMLREFSSAAGFEIGFVRCRLPGEPKPTAEQLAGMDTLRELGVSILPDIEIPKPVIAARMRILRRFLPPREEDLMPFAKSSGPIELGVRSFRPDMLLVLWSDWLSDACARVPIPKFAYYGNPVPKTRLAQLEYAHRTDEITTDDFVQQVCRHPFLEQHHLAILHRFEILGNVAHNDAMYYVKKGHPNAFYIQNFWIDRLGNGWQKRREELETKSGPAVIIGSVGKLGGTANTHAFEYMARFLPRLKEQMAGRPYEVHILGSGELRPGVRAGMDRPEVKIRGFVKDIDDEILAAPIFLCLNNGTAFNVGHTRYLHAWSLGACIVGHVNVGLVYPEIRNGENALLGSSEKEIADLIVRAVDDAALRRRIGESGYRTFKEHFTAGVVVPRIAERIRMYLNMPV